MASDDRSCFTLRVGSYNIGSGEKQGNRDMEHVARDILAKDLDIVGLQKVDIGCWRSGHLHMPRLLSEYTGYAYCYYVECVSLFGPDGKSGSYGDCILSKYPTSKDRHILLEHGNGEPRSLACVQVDVKGTTIHFCNTQLEHGKKRERQLLRSQQLEQVAEQIRGLPRCVLTGCFHCLPEVSCAALPFMTGVCGPEEAHAADNIFFSKDIQLLSCGVLESGNLKHHMRYAQLRVRK